MLLARGDCAAAAERLQWSYLGGWWAGAAVRSLLCAGRREAARLAVDSMVAAARGPGYFNATAVAKGYVGLGDTDEAFRWLERAYEERTVWLIYLPSDAEYAPLRGDPRYASLLQRMRLGP